ncbi:Zinc finger, SWIM-type [Sesbania bispinosa]|nr:Zinc finger, SWIM-type [Sesbania bispinosa]
MVFPLARHRLCAWHLIRNATGNISNPRFTAKFTRCMLGDYGIGRFKSKWDELIREFGLESNQWVRELYEKKKLWATAHIRGSFFARFCTTSRCEGMHAQYLAYTRQKELEEDFESIRGVPVLQTPYQEIESFAAKVYSRKVFMKFRSVIWRDNKLRVCGCERTPNCSIYIVTNRSNVGREWHVSYVDEKQEMKCPCQRMGSLGIPCEHIVVILHYLDKKELPNSLILNRWTKYAKQAVEGAEGERVACYSESGPMFRTGLMSLLFECYELCKVVGKRLDKLDETRGVTRNQMQKLNEITSDANREENNEDENDDIDLRDPSKVRTKGCGSRQVGGAGKSSWRTTTCSLCQGRGHNKKTCGLRRPEGPSITIDTGASGDQTNE